MWSDFDIVGILGEAYLNTQNPEKMEHIIDIADRFDGMGDEVKEYVEREIQKAG
jgi:cell division protein ZapA (FtsZ GTPase activity inhibitor)